MRAAERAIRIEERRLRRRWRRRLRFWLLVTGLGAAANLLSIGLPGSVPLLVGNLAPLALLAYLRWPWVVSSALLVAAATADLSWAGFSLLQIAIALALSRRAMPNRSRLYWQLAWLAPVAAWLARPDDAALLPWISGAVVLLVGSTVAQTGAWQLAHQNRNPALLARLGMGSQLASTLIVATLPALGLLFLALAQAAWQVEILRRGHQLTLRTQQLQLLLDEHVLQHRRAVALLALTAIPPERPRVAAAARTHPGFLSLMVSDAQGRILDFHTPNRPAFVGAVADREYFREPRRTGQPYISPVFRGRGFGQDLLIAISAPYHDADGRFAGIVQGALSLEALERRLNDAIHPQGLAFVVTDAPGHVVVTTLPGLQPMDSGRLAEIAPGGQTSGVQLNRPGTHLLSLRPLPDLGWQIAALEPLAPLAALQTQTALAIGLLCLLALGLLRARVHRLSRSLTEPLDELIARVRQIDLSRSESLRPLRFRPGNAEFAELRDDFNAMLQRIRELTGELRQALEAQESLNRELESRVQQRTAELRAATERAQHLANAKSVLLANMSHELRTPLTAILGHAEEALREARPRRDWEQTLRVVLRNGRHLLDVVNDILDAGRIDAGQLRVEPAEVELQPLVDDVLAMFADRAADKGLALASDYAWPLPATIRADPLRLRQILINLVGNAVKFTEAGEVGVRVSCGDGRLRIAVRDTGIGMDAEQLSRLFRPFEQADASTTRRFGGSGLGLYISAKLAEAMGGGIAVESQPGAGSCFCLSLPLSSHVPLRTAPIAGRPAVEPELPTPRLRGRVLVVDDVEDLRTLTRHVVSATGAEADTAGDGAAAVALAPDGDYDLVLMDMHMPVMDGCSATQALRARGYDRPIVALSADVLAEDVARFRAAGCDEVLAKPIDRAALYRTLQRYLASAEPDTPLLPAGLGNALDGIRQRFRASLAAEASALRGALDGNDMAALQRQLHRLKGSCGTFGFADLGDLAEAAEAVLREGGDWRATCERLHAALVAVRPD